MDSLVVYKSPWLLRYNLTYAPLLLGSRASSRTYIVFGGLLNPLFISVKLLTLFSSSIDCEMITSFSKLLFSGARKEGKFKKKVRVAPVQQKLNIKEP